MNKYMLIFLTICYHLLPYSLCQAADIEITSLKRKRGSAENATAYKERIDKECKLLLNNFLKIEEENDSTLLSKFEVTVNQLDASAIQDNEQLKTVARFFCDDYQKFPKDAVFTTKAKKIILSRLVDLTKHSQNWKKAIGNFFGTTFDKRILQPKTKRPEIICSDATRAAIKAGLATDPKELPGIYQKIKAQDRSERRTISSKPDIIALIIASSKKEYDTDPKTWQQITALRLAIQRGCIAGVNGKQNKASLANFVGYDVKSLSKLEKAIQQVCDERKRCSTPPYTSFDTDNAPCPILHYQPSQQTAGLMYPMHPSMQPMYYPVYPLMHPMYSPMYPSMQPMYYPVCYPPMQHPMYYQPSHDEIPQSSSSSSASSSSASASESSLSSESPLPSKSVISQKVKTSGYKDAYKDTDNECKLLLNNFLNKGKNSPIENNATLLAMFENEINQLSVSEILQNTQLQTLANFFCHTPRNHRFPSNSFTTEAKEVILCKLKRHKVTLQNIGDFFHVSRRSISDVIARKQKASPLPSVMSFDKAAAKPLPSPLAPDDEESIDEDADDNPTIVLQPSPSLLFSSGEGHIEEDTEPTTDDDLLDKTEQTPSLSSSSVDKECTDEDE